MVNSVCALCASHGHNFPDTDVWFSIHDSKEFLPFIFLFYFRFIRKFNQLKRNIVNNQKEVRVTKKQS